MNYKKTYKVSILVPIYNVELYIEKCLHSLFNQTFKEIEFVFVNDRSKDNSIHILNKIIESYPLIKSDIKIVHHEKNLGLAESRNTALKHSSGDYILNVDSDDFLDFKTVEILYDQAVKESSDIVVFNINLYFGINKSKKIIQKVSSDKVTYLEDLLSGKSMPSVCNKLIKRSLYILNNITVPTNLSYGEDFATVPKLVYNAKSISYNEGCYYNYNQTNMNAYTKDKGRMAIDSIIQVYDNLASYFHDKVDSENFLFKLNEGMGKKMIEFIYDLNSHNWEYVKKSFSHIKGLRFTNLSFRERIIYKHYFNSNYILLKIFIKLSKVAIKIKNN